MKTIEKDILTVERGIICQSVNCQGAQNSGVAKAIRNKYPEVFDSYINFINNFKEKCLSDYRGDFETADLLGCINPVQINKELYIVNLFGQNFYGYDGKRYTSYAAWETALPKLKDFANKINLPVYFPYLISCDRGGANFIIIQEMISEYIPDAIFCKLP